MASPPSPPSQDQPQPHSSVRPSSASRSAGRSRARRQVNAESVLVFSRYEPAQPSTPSPTSSSSTAPLYSSPFYLPPRNRTTSNPPPRRRETFIEANGRFALNPLEPPCTDHLQWDSVDIVFVERESVSECPICLQPYTCPKITPCGHVFDHVCLLQHVSHCCANNSVPVVMDDPMITVKCPLCAAHFSLGALKNVDFRNVKSLLPGNTYEMTLVAITPTNVVLPYLGSEDVPADIPDDVADISNLFNRFCFASRNYLADIHAKMAGELRQTLADDPSLKPFVDVASKQVKITKNNLRRRPYPDNNTAANNTPGNSSTNRSIPVDDARIFYQASDARQVFLHPLNHRCIAFEYNGDLRGAAKDIKGSILEVERHTMNETLRKRYRFLRHLPNGCEFALVELNINEELSKETLQHFKKELDARKTARKKKQVISKKETAGKNETLNKALKNYFKLDRAIATQAAPVDDEATFPSLSGSSPRDSTSISVAAIRVPTAHGDADGDDGGGISTDNSPEQSYTYSGRSPGAGWRSGGLHGHGHARASSPSNVASIPVGPVGEAAGWGAAVSSYSSVASNMGLFPALGSSPGNSNNPPGPIDVAQSPPRGAWANSQRQTTAAVGPVQTERRRGGGRAARYRTLQSNAGTNHRR